MHIYWFFSPGNILGILSYETNTKKLLGAVEWNFGKSWGHWIFLGKKKKKKNFNTFKHFKSTEIWTLVFQ